MRLLRLSSLLLGLAVAGCDDQAERPLSLEEQIAGTWEVASVSDVDTGLSLSADFRQHAGDWQFQFESLGCCAGSAAYVLEIETPAGDKLRREGIYYANVGGGIILEDPVRQSVAGGTFSFNAGTPRRMILTTQGAGAVDQLGSGGTYDLSGEPFETTTVRLDLREGNG